MLRRIRIQNHALIHEVEMTLEKGFHVFTGETGSGKSILLGAIGLLLGDRADTSGVGLHGDRAIIEGEFVASSSKAGFGTRNCPLHGLSPCAGRCFETDAQGCSSMTHRRR